ncbi:DUF1194 domain-containing protein [Terrihabitans sp. B22-R8]|uniref:DUF1194 domain-containing protein n=1 Tax=Terrihabitans sp. B22-R8 TaxID=3425128 RepID=UPI00403C025F
MTISLMRCAVLVLALLVVPPGMARAQDAVDVLLVLLADGSGSIDAEEFEMQREGYARAMASPEVLSAIGSNAHQRIAVLFLEWGAPDSQDIVVDWTLIDGAASAEAFGRRLRTQPKLTYGYNSISNAIDFAMGHIKAAPFVGERTIIDVSGDGPNIGGRPIMAARDEAVGQGVTINALAVRSPGSSVALSLGMPLENYYRQNVIGGPGSFVETAEGRDGFAQAIRTKLVLELAANGQGRNILLAGGTE